MITGEIHFALTDCPTAAVVISCVVSEYSPWQVAHRTTSTFKKRLLQLEWKVIYLVRRDSSASV